MPDLIYVVQMPSCTKRAVKNIPLLLTRSNELALAVNVTISRAKVLYILRIEIRRNRKPYLCASIWFLYK